MLMISSSVLKINLLKIILQDQTRQYNKFKFSNIATINSQTQVMSTAKKHNRRRQKKDLLDEEDLEATTQQAKKNQQKDQDIFDAAKLEQNYFVRNGNKNQIQTHDDTISDLRYQQKQVQKNVQNKKYQQLYQKNQQDTTPKKERNTDKKRRRKVGKKQAIFDQQGSDNEDQQNKIQQSTINEKVNLKHPDTPIKLDKQLSQQSQISNVQKKQKKQQKDDFDNIIKDQQEQDEQQQKVVILHQITGKLTKQQRKDFMYQPLGKGQVAFGYFKRFSSGLSQVYQFAGQDHRPLLFCQNQRGCIGCNYYISMTKQMDKNKPTYLGKLRGNASGSTYWLYDSGIQPKNGINRSDWRVSMAAIQYESNFMGFNGPRKLKVTVPSPKHFQDFDTFKLSEQESILNFKTPVVLQLRNKTPKWNEKLKSFALNFGGRVKLASIKNFILIDNNYPVEQQDEADNIIIFGKVDENTFSVEYRHPLSVYQAFGIVMSQFDFKINCQ